MKRPCDMAAADRLTQADASAVYTTVEFCIWPGCHRFVLGPDAPGGLEWLLTERATEMPLLNGRGGYDQGSSYSGMGSGVDLSFLIGVSMLGMTVWNMGGGGRPEGWSLGQLMHRLQNMDLWQMMMLYNLVQQVLGGGRRHGYGGGFGRRRMYF